MLSILLGLALATATPAAPALPEPSNTEVKAMFEADQAARMDENADWEVVTREDTERRKRVRALLDAGSLKSGDDYFYAAFIFQHSHEADDYLLAHTLATTAMAKGHPQAKWIAAATLDRYLHSIGKAQVYGTQKHLGPDDELTVEPYNRTLVTDAMRKAHSVPALADQK